MAKQFFLEHLPCPDFQAHTGNANALAPHGRTRRSREISLIFRDDDPKTTASSYLKTALEQALLYTLYGLEKP